MNFMTETTSALKAIKKVEEKVDEIHNMISVSSRAGRKEVLAELIEYFTKPKPQKKAINIFLNLDGIHDRSWHIKNLKNKGLTVRLDDFSRECKKLYKLGYIQPIKIGDVKVYRRNPEYDRLGIPKDMQKKLKKGDLIA